MPLGDMLITEKEQLHLTEIQKREIEVVYPDSDGEPMGETGFHVRATLLLYEALCHFFRHAPDVYVAADMFLYYKKGNPKAVKAPDVMVIKGVTKHERHCFKIWEEQAVPCVVFEITSKSTVSEDLVVKSFLYASLGVREYFVFDPLAEYLDERLVGFQVKGKEYIPIEPNNRGELLSEELGITLDVNGELIQVIDPRTNAPVPRLEEAIERAEAAEAELARLRELLKQTSQESS